LLELLRNFSAFIVFSFHNLKITSM
jgi:hypothetical protein